MLVSMNLRTDRSNKRHLVRTICRTELPPYLRKQPIVMALQINTAPASGEMSHPRARFRTEDVTLCQLRGDKDIASVMALRQEIDLSAYVTPDGGFYSLEKKGMSAGSSSHSISAIGASGLSEWFRWAMG